MQRLRGFLFFPGKSALEVKKAFSTARIEGIELLMFEKISLYGKDQFAAGLIVEGEMDSTRKKGDLVFTLRKKMGFNDVNYYDVSAESEDYVSSVKSGRKEGNYAQVQILPPFDFDRTSKLAREIGQVLVASDILVRSVSNEKGEPRLGIDLITRTSAEKIRERILNIVPSPPREEGEMTIIEGIHPIAKKS